MRGFVLFLLAFICAAAQAWPVFFQIDDESLLSPRELMALPDGSVIVTFSGPFEDPDLICFSDSGRVLWNRRVLEKGGTSRAFESGGYLTANGDGFAAAFHSEPRATGIDTDVAVISLSSSGEELWTYILGLDDELNWTCTDLVRCSDGGFLVTGCPGNMLPGGYAFRLDDAGQPVWLTPRDVIQGYVLSAVELSDGNFLCLTQEYAGELTIQPLSHDGHISKKAVIDAPGLSNPCCICELRGDTWILGHHDGLVQGVCIDDSCKVTGSFSRQFSPDVDIRSLEPRDSLILLTGGLEGSGGFLAVLDTQGVILFQDTVETADDYPFQHACLSGDHILAFTPSQLFRVSAANLER